MPPEQSHGVEERGRHAEWVTGASYGTVLTIAALLVVEADDVASGWGWEIVVGVGVATWVAHIYAELMGNRVRMGGRVQVHEVRAAMTDGFPILLAALIPAFALLMGRIGLVHPERALWIGIVLAILQLVAIGAIVARVSDDRSGTWRYAVTAAVLGVVVVALVVALGH